MAKAPLLLRIRAAGQALFTGAIKKEFIPALSMFDWPDAPGQLKTFRDRNEQLTANLNWCYAANKAIVDPAGAVELKVGRRNRDGDIEEAKQSDRNANELRELLSIPNNMHTWEQTAQLHHTYMNFNGEGYTMMLRAGRPWVPRVGQLPHALQEIPANRVQFKMAQSGAYSDSTIKYLGQEYQIGMFVRDLNPDPANPIYGLSIISAAASVINADESMRDWNNHLMANGASPSLVFTTKDPSGQPMDDVSYERWKQQFQDEHTGTQNAGKPLLIENGDVKAVMLSPKDLDFLESRKFTRDEILAIWRVNPYIIGSVEDVNLATAKASRMQHAEINIEPRVRQWVRQLNATMVSVFDPGLVLYYDPVVPDDEDAKLKYHETAVGKWETPDEARGAYGEDPLPDEMGTHIIVASTSTTLDAVIEGVNADPAGDSSGSGSSSDPDNDGDDDESGTNDPDKDGKASKALAGVKKKS